MKANSVFAVLSFLIASSAWAGNETPAQKSLKDFAEDVCNRPWDSYSRGICFGRLNGLPKDRAPADEQALAVAKLEVAQVLCSGGNDIAEDCWRNVERRLGDERKKAEKKGGVDTYHLAEAVSRAIATCPKSKIKASCVAEKVNGIQSQVATGAQAAPYIAGADVASLGAASRSVIASTAAAPIIGAATGNSTMGTPPLPCTAATDRGVEVKVGDKSPLGEGTKLIVYSNAITVWSGNKARHIYNTKAGWMVWNGDRDKGTTGGTPGGCTFTGKIKFIDGLEADCKSDSLIIRNSGTPATVTTVKLPQDPSGTMLATTVEVATAAGAPLGQFTSQISRTEHDAGTKEAVKAFEGLPIKNERQRAQESFYNSFRERMLSGPAVSMSLGSTPLVRNGCSTKATNEVASAATDGRSGGTDNDRATARDTE